MSLQVKPFSGTTTEWTAFITAPEQFRHSTFFHTWQWGEHIQAGALSFERLGVYDNDRLVGVANAGEYRLRLGGKNYWYVPRGIAMDYADDEVVKQAYLALREYFKTKGCALVRFDPNVEVEENSAAVLLDLPAKSAAVWPQVERVWVADLHNSPEEQLAWLKEHGMRKRLVSQLRKAEREGVEFTVSTEPADLETFLELLNDLDGRKGGIGKHSDDYYRAQFAIMSPCGNEVLIKASKDGEVLAMAFMAVFGREASYLHGASSEKWRNLVGPQFMHFSFMNYLRQHQPEVQIYNFWGVISEEQHQKNHPGGGYSAFKRNFGGYEVNYIRAQDFVFDGFWRSVNFWVDKVWAWKHREALGY
jgi:lipid II:glycine glycyltransferase (peptidoglycan interpeptide bridge formation enzyme)